MDERIVASAARELDGLVRALRGGFVVHRRRRRADPQSRRLPDRQQLLRHRSRQGAEAGVVGHGRHARRSRCSTTTAPQHGRYPQKVSFVIWGDETMRHEGVVESQIFYLLGTKPVWNARGKVVDVQVMPRAQLNRPRVDIVIASAAEGMFNNVTQLMDKAVQKVKALDEADNYVRRTTCHQGDADEAPATRSRTPTAAPASASSTRRPASSISTPRRLPAPAARGTPTRGWPTTTSASSVTPTATASGASRWRTSSAWRSRAPRRSSTAARRRSTARSTTTTCSCTWAGSPPPSATSTARRRRWWSPTPATPASRR